MVMDILEQHDIHASFYSPKLPFVDNLHSRPVIGFPVVCPEPACQGQGWRSYSGGMWRGMQLNISQNQDLFRYLPLQKFFRTTLKDQIHWFSWINKITNYLDHNYKCRWLWLPSSRSDWQSSDRWNLCKFSGALDAKPLRHHYEISRSNKVMSLVSPISGSLSVVVRL